MRFHIAMTRREKEEKETSGTVFVESVLESESESESPLSLPLFPLELPPEMALVDLRQTLLIHITQNINKKEESSNQRGIRSQAANCPGGERDSRSGVGALGAFAIGLLSLHIC